MSLIRGSNLNNLLQGTALDDLFAGLGGDDTLTGGAGTDTAWYSGNLAGYSFSSVGGRLVVRDTATADGSDGRDSLAEIEKLQFSNAQLSVTSAEFRVNSYAANNQSYSALTALPGGGFVASWTSRGQDGSSDGIYAQRYDAYGAAVGAEFQVNTHSLNEQYESTLAALSDGGFVVSWTSYGQDGASYGIYGQRFDANGAAVGVEFQVNTYSLNDQIEPELVGLSAGGFVVSWASDGNDGSGFGIYAQRYDVAGVAAGAEFLVNTSNLGSQTQPTLAALSGGGFVVGWTSADQDDFGIYARRYDVDGAAEGAEFQVNTYTTDYQWQPTFAALADGGFVVSWASRGQDGSLDGIYAQRFDATGVAVGDEFQVNTTTNSHQTQPALAALSHGGFVVIWHSQDSSNYGINAQRYDADGAAVGGEFRVNTYAAGQMDMPTLAALPDGGFVVSWTSTGQDGSGGGIYAQRYDANGNPVGLKLTGTAAGELINLDAGQLLTVDGADGADTINGASGADVLIGGDGKDLLRGNDGNDLLDGGSGTDNMAGGLGDDDYVVDTLADILTEAIGAGNDNVSSSVSWTLAINFENLRLTGTANINATGNTTGNFIEGNSGNNVLNGGLGADILSGGAGDDTYVVESAYDNIDELAGMGTDLVESSVSWILQEGLENLTLTGLASVNGTGNVSANTLIGNALNNLLLGLDGDDAINGKAGNDLINGGDGADMLTGDLGNDVLIGGSGIDDGVDTLNGGLGSDTLTGGNDNDVFIFNTALGKD